MPYIGRGPAKSGAFRILDDVSGSFNGSTTSCALTVGSAALTVGLPETLLIAVDGVIQEAGSAYTISGSNIVFTAAPQADATFWGVELGDVGGIAQQAVTQSASDDSTSIATTAYVDNQIDVQLTAEGLDVTGDSGTIAIDLDSEALAITGGTGITTTASGNAVNIVGHAEAHTVASHSDTTGTGAELETLTDGSNAESLHTHTHTAASHSDVTASGAELNKLDGASANVTAANLNILTDSSSTTALHAHAATGAQIATGTYTGNGSTSHAITGIGFAPKYVKIWASIGSSALDADNIQTDAIETTDSMVDNNGLGMAWQHLSGDNNPVMRVNRIIAIGSDGFTVDDAGDDTHPNKNNQVYEFLCLG